MVALDRKNLSLYIYYILTDGKVLTFPIKFVNELSELSKKSSTVVNVVIGFQRLSISGTNGSQDITLTVSRFIGMIS